MKVYFNSELRVTVKQALSWEIIQRETQEQMLKSGEWFDRLFYWWLDDLCSPIKEPFEVDILNEDLVVDYNQEAIAFLRLLSQKMAMVKDYADLSLREIYVTQNAVDRFGSTIETVFWLEGTKDNDAYKEDNISAFFEKIWNQKPDDEKGIPDYYDDDFWEHELKIVDKITDYLEVYLPEHYKDMHYIEEASEKELRWFKELQPAVAN